MAAVSQVDRERARAELLRAVEGDESQVDLARAALWIAAESVPQLDVDRYLEQIDALASSIRPEVALAGSPDAAARALLRALCEDHGFSGNQDDYYDPRNSYLSDVLDRRTGLPITLSIVLIAVGRRLGVPLQGVGLPGHFIARTPGEPPVLLDAFTGLVLRPGDCQDLVRQAVGPAAELLPEHLRPAAPRTILVRVLTNLKHVHARGGDLEAALSCSDRILALAPDAAPELRDRALLYAQLECFGAALADLERYVALVNDPNVARRAEPALAELRERARQVH